MATETARGAAEEEEEVGEGTRTTAGGIVGGWVERDRVGSTRSRFSTRSTRAKSATSRTLEPSSPSRAYKVVLRVRLFSLLISSLDSN